MFDFVRNNTKIMMGILFLLIIPSFVLFGLEGYSRFNDKGAVVAKVNGNKINQTDWDAAHKREVDRIRASMPNIDAKLFDSAEAIKQNTAVEVAVVPTRYSDCAPVIEKTLTKMSAREFVTRLCAGPHSIVKTDEKGLSQWQRWAEMAKSTRVGMDNLHVALKPFIEETLLNNVLIAQSQWFE